jgi:hypothetical protein
MPDERMNLLALVKTIQGELQTAQYYNSNAIFARDDHDILFYIRKVRSILDGVKEKIEALENVKDDSNERSS